MPLVKPFQLMGAAEIEARGGKRRAQAQVFCERQKRFRARWRVVLVDTEDGAGRVLERAKDGDDDGVARAPSAGGLCLWLRSSMMYRSQCKSSGASSAGLANWPLTGSRVGQQ